MSVSDLEAISAAKEVTIETHSGSRVYRTVIWVAANDEVLYVRSFLGDAGRWFQRTLVEPEVTIVAGDRRVAFRAIPATDDQSIEAASEGFRRKYPKGRSLDAMLVPDVLHTTLRLDPVS